jgi:drug/metabolite transporter (DMT)-like permease
LPTVRQIRAASGKLLAIAIFKERYTLRQWAGMAVLILALSLFFYEQLNIAPEPLTLLGFTGAILVVAGCMAIALGKSSSVRP